jgi:predicted Holliday junction resolvase-like endonuclease
VTTTLLILLAFIVALACIGEIYLARQRRRNIPPSNPFMQADELEELQKQYRNARRKHKPSADIGQRLREARTDALRRERGAL